MIQNNCPGEEIWDRYIRRRDEKIPPDLESHLRGCPYCRFYLSRRREELSSYAEFWNTQNQGEIVELRPWPGLPADNTIENRMAAKAQGNESDTESISLLSPDQNVMLKAVRDKSTGEVWLYLISDDPSHTRSVLVRPFDISEEFLTDEKGRINLGKIKWPSAENQQAEVKMPFATFTMIPMRDIIDDKDYVVLTTSEGDQVKVTLANAPDGKIIRIQVAKLVQLPPNSPLKLGVRHEKKSQLMLIDSEQDMQMTLSNIAGYEPIEIYLFK